MTCDVLIVGGGLSAGVMALTLVEKGFTVTCLEQGGWTDPAAYPGGTPFWELARRTKWSADPNVRRAPSDYPIDVSESDMAIMLYNGVGGSSVLFGAQWARLTPGDFRVRTLDGVADDWPISWRDIWPFYEMTDREFGISGLGGDPAYPEGEDYPLPPLPLSSAGTRMAKTFDELGWHWWPGSNAIISRNYDDRRPCVLRGTCQTGCGEGAKSSSDQTHWRKAVAKGVKLITGARVREIMVSDNGLATGAVYFDRDGKEHRVDASVVVMAAGGVGTPRILLNSTAKGSGAGLANSSGLVGKRFMGHPYVRIVGYFDEPLKSWHSHAGANITSLQFYGTDPDRDFVRGSKWAVVPTRGPLDSALSLPDDDSPWGENLHLRVNRELGHGIALDILPEDLPEEANRVTLCDDGFDSDGIPAAKVSYSISENTSRIRAFNVARATEALKSAGAHEIHVSDPATSGMVHLLGTARMGNDPETSVVDKWGRTHDVPNLFIIDASIFVTAGAVNPAATVAALAKRTSLYLAENSRDQVTA